VGDWDTRRDAGDRVLVLAPHALVKELHEVVAQTRQMIERASTATEAVNLVRRASATSGVVKEALKSCHLLGGQQFALRQEVAEVHLRTQRRAGELLLAMAKHRGGRPSGTGSMASSASSLPVTLKDLGISPRESHRWQRVAQVPAERFEEHIATCRAQRRELTTAGVLALAADEGRSRAQGSNQEPAASRLIAADVHRAKRRLWTLVWIDPVNLAAALEPGRREFELERLEHLDRWLRGYENVLCEGAG
jgi:hypothetical protein